MLFRTILVAMFAALLSLPASAVQPIGSAGWTDASGGVLYAGPGREYGEIDTIDGALRIRVDRCTQRWCSIRAGSQRGWIQISRISFGTEPDGLRKPIAKPIIPKRGEVCFYSGANFTGDAFCAKPGKSYKDLALVGRDNEVSSIEVGPGVKALVCRDRWYRSYCVMFRDSDGRIEGLLDNAVSSVSVY